MMESGKSTGEMMAEESSDQDRTLVLFVCTANICRSPMAEKLLEHALAAEPSPLSRLEVASAGVAACHGEPASPNSHKALQKVGLTLADHCSQPVSHELLDRSLAIFGMTESHRALLTYHFDSLPEHVYLMREFLDSNHEIPDPYGMNLPEYEACRDSMVEAIPSIVRFLKQIRTH